MRTFLYNTQTGEKGKVRDGRYLVDGKPGELPQYLVELEIYENQVPAYNQATQTLTYTEYADIANKRWVKSYGVRNLTQQEIEDRKPKVPSCTPRQFRLALVQSNIDINQIETMINGIQDENERKIALIEWEYSIEIKRDHPLISSFAAQLALTQEQVDNIFILANTFD